MHVLTGQAAQDHPESRQLSQDLNSNLLTLEPQLSLCLANSSSIIAQTHMQTSWLGMAEDTKFILYLPSSIQPSCGQRVGCYKPGCAQNISNLSPRNAQGHVSCRKARRIMAITSNDGSSQGGAGLAGKLSLCCDHRGS